MSSTKEQIFNIMAVVDYKMATTAHQNQTANASPFGAQSLMAFYQQVAKFNPGAKVVQVPMNNALKIGYGNSNKAFFTPAAEGHIFFRSITEGIVPVHKVLPPYLPDTEDFERRSAYGTFPYKADITLPQGNAIPMVLKDGIYYWLDFLPGKRENAFQLFWCAAEANAFKGR